VLRITGHSKRAGLQQVFAAISDIVYIWQAQVLREKGQEETAKLIEKMGNGKARRIKNAYFVKPICCRSK
jgi:dTDP-4-dehydrorhamnose reductase